MSAKTLALQKERESRYVQSGLDKNVAKNLSLKDVVSRMCEVLSVRSHSSAKLSDIAKAYIGVVSRLGIEDLMAQLDGMSMPNRWDQELLENSRSKITDSLRSLVIKASSGASAISSLGEGTPALARIRDILADIHQRGVSLATISLLADDMPKLNA